MIKIKKKKRILIHNFIDPLKKQIIKIQKRPNYENDYNESLPNQTIRVSFEVTASVPPPPPGVKWELEKVQ